MAIENGNKVKIEYKAMFEDGKVFDSSNNFEFEVGKGTVIKGVNDAVIGMEKGEEKNITLKPNDAYGMPEKKYIIKIPNNKYNSSKFFQDWVDITNFNTKTARAFLEELSFWD